MTPGSHSLRVMKLLPQLAILIVAFAATTGIALALGAANLGTALTFGQIVFVLVLVVLLLRN